jgi:hypothetical protein
MSYDDFFVICLKFTSPVIGGLSREILHILRFEMTSVLDEFFLLFFLPSEVLVQYVF